VGEATTSALSVEHLPGVCARHHPPEVVCFDSWIRYHGVLVLRLCASLSPCGTWVSPVILVLPPGILPSVAYK
jgi:hypothetical protein